MNTKSHAFCFSFFSFLLIVLYLAFAVFSGVLQWDVNYTIAMAIFGVTTAVMQGAYMRAYYGGPLHHCMLALSLILLFAQTTFHTIWLIAFNVGFLPYVLSIYLLIACACIFPVLMVNLGRKRKEEEDREYELVPVESEEGEVRSEEKIDKQDIVSTVLCFIYLNLIAFLYIALFCNSGRFWGSWQFYPPHVVLDGGLVPTQKSQLYYMDYGLKPIDCPHKGYAVQFLEDAILPPGVTFDPDQVIFQFDGNITRYQRVLCQWANGKEDWHYVVKVPCFAKYPPGWITADFAIEIQCDD